MTDDLPLYGSGPYRDGKPLTAESLHQRVLNMSWPERDKDGSEHARNIKTQPVDNWRPVRVRLELARDGVVVLDGMASRWTRSHVFVSHIDDPRVAGPGVWVRARDVEARTPTNARDDDPTADESAGT